MQFSRLGNTIVILILPKQEASVNGVSLVNETVTVATMIKVVEYSKGQESIRILRRRLLSEISK